MKYIIETDMAPWCKDIFTSDKRHIVIHGGRGSGKSEGIAQLLVIKSLRIPNTRIVCGREIQRSIRESSKALIEKWVRKLGLESIYKVTHYSIKNVKNESEFLFYGLSDETKNNITSISEIKYLWIDEAHTITEATWKRVYPSIRAQGSQIYITFNPHFETDVMYRDFIVKKREDTLVRQVNYKDNPWFFDTPLEMQRQIDKQMKPPLYYEHVWEGGLCEYNDEAVINIEKINRYNLTTNAKYSKIIITIDTAFSTKEYADYSALGAFGLHGNEIHVINVRRGRWEFHDLKCELLAFYNDVKSQVGNVDKVIIENKASGLSLIQELKRTTSLRIDEYTPTKDKYTRVVEALETLHSGRFCVPLETNTHTSWVRNYLRELSMFTGNNTHDHDDQVDITTMAIRELTKPRIYIDYKQVNKGLLNLA